MSDKAVADTGNEAGKDPASATDGTQDQQGLDDILASYDNEIAGADETLNAKGETKPSDTVGLDADTVESLKQMALRQNATEFDNTMNSAIKTMQEAVGDDLPVVLSDKVWKGILYEAAESDPRVKQAYVQRHKNPSGFAKVLKALARDAVGSMTVSKDATQNREQVNSAVRASRKQPQTEAADDDAAYRKKWHGMSPDEKRRERERLKVEARFG